MMTTDPGTPGKNNSKPPEVKGGHLSLFVKAPTFGKEVRFPVTPLSDRRDVASADTASLRWTVSVPLLEPPRLLLSISSVIAYAGVSSACSLISAFISSVFFWLLENSKVESQIKNRQRYSGISLMGC